MAGFAIGEGAAYDPASSSYLAAFRVGLGNTLLSGRFPGLGLGHFDDVAGENPHGSKQLQRGAKRGDKVEDSA